MIMLKNAPDGIQVLGDRSEAKIGDACMIEFVHKNVCLARCQYGGETRLRTTYSPEVPMNHIAGVEVVEALGNIRQLVAGVSVR